MSGNDFQVLPQSYSSLTNLTELYLNDEKKMDINKSLLIIKDLPNLKILHLENDNLKSIPSDLLYFNNLEKLYLNNNKFRQTPVELQELKELNFIDLHDNKYKLNYPEIEDQGFGIKIQF